MGKKQPWFFKKAEQMLKDLRSELKEELDSRELQLLFTVSHGHGRIMIWIARLRRKRIPVDILSPKPIEEDILWSSLHITNIVDFDIALENLREWIKDPKPKGQDVADAPAAPATDNLVLDSLKATLPRMSM